MDFHEAHGLTSANEDYLEAIVELARNSESGHDSVRSVDIANKLNVSKASVNKAVNMLKNAGLINQHYYGKIELTDAGREYGESVWFRHRLLKRFLIERLGVDEETAEGEACEMEHAISLDTMHRWADFMHRTEGMSSVRDEG